jgi:hypothetical protein
MSPVDEMIRTDLISKKMRETRIITKRLNPLYIQFQN